MITIFNYYGHDVTIRDSEGVKCKDKETRKDFKMQFDFYCSDIAISPAGMIGKSMEDLGIKVTFIDDYIIY